MKINDQYALNAFRQAQAFLEENAGRIGVIKDSEGRKLLDEVIGQLSKHGIDQSSVRLEIGGHSNLQGSLELDLKKAHMLPIASFARAKLRGVPDYATLTRSVIKLKGPALVRAARAVATAAQPYAEALVKGGFPADTLAQLSTAADTLEGTIDSRATLKTRRVGATTGISEEVKRGNEALRMLGAVIERQFAKDKAFLAAWRSAKRIVAKPGVVRGTVAGSAAGSAAQLTDSASV